jgi:L-2-hydroxyglutarate oxidase LhgO
VYDAAVIGGGIVGLATAYQLLRRSPGLRIVILEKEAAVGLHQSSHNSGVLHAGVYYAPGSLKARCCVRGKRLLEEFADEHGILVLRRGKLIVATTESELPALRTLVDRAQQNGVPDVRLVGPDTIRDIEPAVAGVMALHSPGTAVIDFGVVCDVLAESISDQGGELRTSADVVVATETTSGVRISSTAGDIEAKVALGCVGLQADRLATAMGMPCDVRVAAIPGGWFEVRPEAAAQIRGNIYSVPDARFPFLGVHLTRRIDDCVWAGPDAPPPGSDALREAGLRREQAWRQLQHLVPELAIDDLRSGPTGVRAQAIWADGSMIEDFLIRSTPRAVHVLNAPSPAATSSLALGEHLASQLEDRLAGAA